MPKALTLREQAKKAPSAQSVRTVARMPRVHERQKSPLLGKILAPTDFSEEAKAGVWTAISMAQSFGADLEFIYVVEPPSGLSRMRAEPEAQRSAALERAAQQKLNQLAKLGEVGEESEVSGLVGVGKPFDKIVDAARKGKANLIVMSKRGRSGLKRMVLGSTTENVVRYAPCPVLTVPATWKEKKFRPTIIFVPIDFSDLSKSAMAYARLLAEVCGAEVVLGHAVDMSALLGLARTQLGHQMVVPALAEARADLEKWASELREWMSAPVSTQVELGRPTEEVWPMAKRAKADLIILTTHGKTGLKRMLIGSTAESVVRSAECPVLVVRGTRPKLMGF